jgi:hypothetical protein
MSFTHAFKQSSISSIVTGSTNSTISIPHDKPFSVECSKDPFFIKKKGVDNEMRKKSSESRLINPVGYSADTVHERFKWVCVWGGACVGVCMDCVCVCVCVCV